MYNSLPNILLFVSSIISLILGTFVLLAKRKATANILLAITVFCSAIWGLSLLVTIITANLFAARATFAIASFIPTLLIAFMYAFRNKHHRTKNILLILAPTFAVAYLSLKNNFLIEQITITKEGFIEINSNGPFLLLYELYFVSAILVLFYVMFTTYKHVTGISKIQLKFLLIGVLLSLGLGSLVNLLLPSLGIYELNNLGPVFTLFLSGSIIYASTKHHLLETKVILSEVWSVILILTILVWLLMDPSIAGFIMFVMVSSISVLFVKSTLSESAKNEQITRQNAQLEKDKKKLLELDRMKDEFLQMATHELNTPIVSIQGRLHMAIVENFAKLNANQKEFLSPILRDTKRLASLSKNILDVARISQNRLHLFRTEVDFPDLVASIVEGFELRAKERGNKLIYHPPKEAIPLLYLDQVKITEVISNLLSNAIKFTDKGTVAVAVELKDSMVVISVSDSGIGISQEDQDKLFAKFYQANRFSKDRPQEQQGSGLGLFISKNIIELHGGKIWVSSTLGKGTTFYFSLPVKAKMGEKTTKK